jgi:MFS transporter, DHA2 family, multidrug resistance protein
VNPFNQAMQMPDVAGMINMNTDHGRAMADVMIALQAQIIAFSQDYEMVMMFILCSIPLAIMIGSTKAALRKQPAGPEHAVME